jgi:hypothetical protein
LEEVGAAQADVVVRPGAAVVAACFGWEGGLGLWCCCWRRHMLGWAFGNKGLTSAAEREGNEEPRSIWPDVAKVYHCADCEEYDKDPACYVAGVVGVEVEVCFALRSWKEQIVVHSEIVRNLLIESKEMLATNWQRGER